MTPEPVLRIERLSFAYTGQPPIFVDWSADFAPGVSWIVGGDGSGKTSLLKLIAGELTATGHSTCFRLDGDLLAPGRGGRRGRVAWCDPQTEDMHALTPLDWFDRLRAEHPSFDAGRLQQHLVGFDLTPHLAKPIYQLSTGSRRKVFLAGNLASSAPLTLLDQPLAALDDASCRHLLKSLALCAADNRGRAWLVADHQPPDTGLRLAGLVRLES